MRYNSIRGMAFAGLLTSLAACQTSSDGKPLPAPDYVDLARFMGDWYVLGNIPTFIEVHAFNAVETYALNDDGTIATTFAFNRGAFDGPRKVYNPKGFVRPSTGNAEWGMQFIWPFKAEYRVLYVDADYQYTVIGRSKRDYAWIMARAPHIPDARYAQLVDVLRNAGYDTQGIRRVPQQPLDER